MSGSEIAWDLDHKGDAKDRQFFRHWLRAKFLADASRFHRVKGRKQSVPLRFSFGGHWLYPVAYPDVISPQNGAQSWLFYPDGRAAGICYRGKYKLVYLAFPFESVHPEKKRVQLMEKILDFLR